MNALPSDFLYAEKSIMGPHECRADLYQAIYESARRLTPADAFYICLIDQRSERLTFVYHGEGDLYGPGNEVPFGSGPTTRVARSGKQFIMADETERGDLHTFPFGIEETQSSAAVHWPLWIHADPRGLPDGVLSVQSYRGGVYDYESLAAVEWLALRSQIALRCVANMAVSGG